jgi:integrase
MNETGDKEAGNRYGMGRCYLRGRTWWVQYSFRGKTVRESSGSEKEQDAKRLLKKRLGEMGRGRLVGPAVERTTFADLEQMIKDDYAVNQRKSFARLNTSLTHLRDYFGLCRAVDITGDRLNGYVRDRLQQDPAPARASVGLELAALKRAFTLARKAGKVSELPPFPTITVQNARQGFFEEGDFKAVLAKLDDDIRPLAEFAHLTGWRVGECRLLTWAQNVDLDGGWVRLEPGTTKNTEGRAFPLRGFPELEALLKRQRERTEALQMETETIIPWVFHREGERVGSFRKSWNTACKDAGTPGRLFHDLRRTAVRNLERAGVSRSAAMKLTGHKTESVYRRYAIVAESDLQEAVAKVALHRDREAVAAAARKVVPLREKAQNDHNSAAGAASVLEAASGK